MGSDRKMATGEVAERVREHGGILESIEWGLRSTRIEDPELATAWRRIETEYESLRPNILVASRMLTAARRAA